MSRLDVGVTSYRLGNETVRSAIPALSAERAPLRTLWAITFMGAGLGVITAMLVIFLLIGLDLTLGSFPLLFMALGFGFMVVYARAFGVTHGREARVSLLLGLLAGAAGVLPRILFSDTSSMSYAQQADALRSTLLLDTIFVVLGSGSVFVAMYSLQEGLGRGLIIAGLLAAIVIQPVVLSVAGGAIDRGLTDALAARSGAPLVSGVSSDWGRIGALNAIPLGLFTAGYERLYWRLRGRFPGLRLWEG